MPTELKAMKVDFISLVSKGANGKKIVWKSGGKTPNGAKPEEPETFETSLKATKKSEEKRMVYGIVYSPDQVDSQGEYATGAEIEKAAYGFMKGLRLLNVDAQHDFDPKEAFVAESWLTKGADALFPGEPEGSWAVGIRVEDDALWEDVKKGSLAGISMAGTAAKMKKGDDGFLAKMEELLTRLLKGSEGKGSDGKGAEGKKEGEKNADFDDEIIKLAKVLESAPALIESIAKIDERLTAMEKATPGQMSKGLDGGGGDDGISFA
jgi:hypothetical protein